MYARLNFVHAGQPQGVLTGHGRIPPAINLTTKMFDVKASTGPGWAPSPRFLLFGRGEALAELDRMTMELHRFNIADGVIEMLVVDAERRPLTRRH